MPEDEPIHVQRLQLDDATAVLLKHDVSHFAKLAH